MIKDIALNLKQLKILLELKEIHKAEEYLDKIMTSVYLARKNNTRCGYCHEIVPYNEVGLLCEDCRETFGHSLLEEL